MISQKSIVSLKHLDKNRRKSRIEKKVEILAELVKELGQKVNGLCSILAAIKKRAR